MKKIINKTLFFLIVAVSLTSCLKDDSAVLDPDKSAGNIIEFKNPGNVAVVGSKTALYVLSYPIVDTETIVPISVAYVGAENGAPQDITVTIALDNQALIDQYNNERSASDEDFEDYLFMPSESFSIKTTTVTIPKGAKSASFNIGLKTSLFDLTKSFVVPIKIVSTSYGTLSGNFSRVLLAFGAKNPYDGLYSYKTSANTSLVPNANKKNVPLVTAGPNTVTTNLLDTYSNIITYNIDPSTNKVTVVSIVGPIGAPITDPASNWNPATKVLYVKWTAGSRRFEETYTYTGVR